jgi:hypothetical protein
MVGVLFNPLAILRFQDGGDSGGVITKVLDNVEDGFGRWYFCWYLLQGLQER